MKKLIITKGLPASGKTTWSKTFQKDNPTYKRISKDDLRNMLDGGLWSKKNEEFILLLRDTIALAALEKGYNVVVDDTNLHPKHLPHMQELAKEAGAELEIKDFTDVPLEVCLERDKGRPNYVGEKVIKQMWRQFLKSAPPKIKENPKLFRAVMCDLDGTLALFGDNDPYNRNFLEDEPNWPVVNLLHSVKETANDNIILVSGRDGKYREQTKQWLEKWQIPYRKLHMRKTGDKRKDSFVKEEIYNNHIKDKYNVMFVLDDRDQVVELWRGLGLPCFQVNWGDF